MKDSVSKAVDTGIKEIVIPSDILIILIILIPLLDGNWFTLDVCNFHLTNLSLNQLTLLNILL